MISFRNKLVLAFISFGILLISVSLILVFKMQDISLKENSIEKAEQSFQAFDNKIQNYLKESEYTLPAIERSYFFQMYLKDPVFYKQEFYPFIYSLALASEKNIQIRFIDKAGREQLRLERNGNTNEIKFIPDEKLQDKKQRYYFNEAINTDESLYFSKIDLNMEHGKIEQPPNPVIRIAKKIKFNNEVNGILIINLFMGKFLDELSSSPVFDIYLIDKNGYFLIHPDKNKRWGNYLKTGYNLRDDFGVKDAACILNNPQCQTESFYASQIKSLHNADKLKLIIKPRMVQIRLKMNELLQQMIYISVFVLMFSFPIAYMFSIIPVRLKNEVDRLNATLEEKIAEKVNELKDTNVRLEEMVLQRTKELEEANTKLYKQATIDALTGIPNRRYFFEMSDRYLQLSHRKRQTLSFVVLDIDFFKQVNDTYGHNIGDRVLQHVVNQIADSLRRSDIFGRIGGEEFAIALLDTDLQQAYNLAEKIRLTIQQTPYRDKRNTIMITISLGVSQAQPNDQDISVILSRADIALYQAKESGRNKAVLSKPEEIKAQ